jgi:hypothetical protein
MAKSKKKSAFHPAQLPLLLLCGIWFGFFFERSRVYHPESVRYQFIFKRWILLKMFMGACFGAAMTFWFFHRLDLALITKNGGTANGIEDKLMLPKMRRDNLIRKPWWMVGIGGALLGCGMVTAGACPGMVMSQLGTGLENSWATFVGCLVGALVWNVVNQLFLKGGEINTIRPIDLKAAAAGAGARGLDNSTRMSHEYFDLRAGKMRGEKGEQSQSDATKPAANKRIPAFLASLDVLLPAFAVMCLLCSLVLELLFPFMSYGELPLVKPGQNQNSGAGVEFDAEAVRRGAWAPSLCGFAIGMTNLFVGLICRQSMGSSTGYSALMAVPAAGICAACNAVGIGAAENENEFVVASKKTLGSSKKEVACPAPHKLAVEEGECDDGDKFCDDEDKGCDDESPSEQFLLLFWQLPYLLSAILGAYLSASVIPNRTGKLLTFPSQVPGIDPLAPAFIGGFLMLFGSRMGGGCTSGHGIAGMPMMNMYAMLGVGAMFGAGIVLAFIMEFGTEKGLALQ